MQSNRLRHEGACHEKQQRQISILCSHADCDVYNGNKAVSILCIPYRLLLVFPVLRPVRTLFVYLFIYFNLLRSTRPPCFYWTTTYPHPLGYVNALHSSSTRIHLSAFASYSSTSLATISPFSTYSKMCRTRIGGLSFFACHNAISLLSMTNAGL